MLFSIRKLTKLQLIALSLVSLFGLTIFAMTIQKLTFHSFSVRQKTPVVSANLVASGQKEVKKSIEVIVVTLNPDGFFPKEVIVPKKPFLLSINNRTGLREKTFNLFREKSNDKLQERKLKQETMSLQWELNLSSGNHELRESNNPNWVLLLRESNK